MSELPCARLLLGVSGSIHSLNLPLYLVDWRRQFAEDIRVIMTATASHMLPPQSVALYCEQPPYVNLWGSGPGQSQSPHIRLSKWADLFVILPATADVIGKIANGIADDLLTTTALAYNDPIIFAPAMNPSMWQSKALQRNLRQLAEDGHYIIQPSQVASITTDTLGLGLGPTPDEVLPHLWHVLMKEKKERYWEKATSVAPATPAAVTQGDIPVLASTARR